MKRAKRSEVPKEYRRNIKKEITEFILGSLVFGVTFLLFILVVIYF